MALINAIQGSTHTPEHIVWTRADDTPQDLTGATVTAQIVSWRTGSARAATGNLVVTDATHGAFTWTYSAADVAEAGDFRVQFTATYQDSTPDRTYAEKWTVEPGLGS